MTTSALAPGAFSAALRKWSNENLPNAVKQRQGYVCKYLWERILRRTPVDTSLARGNWWINIGTPSSYTTLIVAGVATVNQPLTAYEQAQLNAVLQRLEELPLGQTVWISNNLHYVKFLEGGTSDQAPTGMVMVSIAEVRDLVFAVTDYRTEDSIYRREET
jgi:hypothetical protein